MRFEDDSPPQHFPLVDSPPSLPPPPAALVSGSPHPHILNSIQAWASRSFHPYHDISPLKQIYLLPSFIPPLTPVHPQEPPWQAWPPGPPRPCPPPLLPPLPPLLPSPTLRPESTPQARGALHPRVAGTSFKGPRRPFKNPEQALVGPGHHFKRPEWPVGWSGCHFRGEQEATTIPSRRKGWE